MRKIHKSFYMQALLILGVLTLAASCSDHKYPQFEGPDPDRSEANAILGIDFPKVRQDPQYYDGAIDFEIFNELDSVAVTVPWYAAAVLAPEITVANNSTVSPISGSVRDFSQGPVIYTVRAENGAKREWTVNVTWMDEPEPLPRPDNPRRPLEVTDKYGIHKIPLYSNTYIPSGSPGTVNSSNGINGTSNSGYFSVYFNVRYQGELQLALRGRSGNTTGNDVNVKIYINGEQATADGMLYDHTYTYSKTNQNTDTLTIHRVVLPEIPAGTDGNMIRMDISAVGTMNGSYYFRFPELWVSGWATRGKGGSGNTGLNWVPTSNEHFGKRGPSVHIRPETHPAGNLEYFYSEVYIPVGQDPVGSYFMCNGFGQGYNGIQVNSATERRILFSVWSAWTTDKPSEMGNYRPKLVRVNNQPTHRPNFTYQNFGGEGSGGQSFFKYMWEAGKTYKLLTRVRPHPDQETYPYSTLYKAWFHNGEEWIFIAEWRRIELYPEDNDGKESQPHWYKGAHHFLENFSPGMGYIERYGTWDNQWFISNDREYHEVEKWYFTNDATASAGDRIDFGGGIRPAGDPQAGAVYLRMGGYFTDNTKYGSVFTKPLRGNTPVLDFDALNAMGTDDRNVDPILDPDEKYEE